jgi:hypothetical protein
VSQFTLKPSSFDLSPFPLNLTPPPNGTTSLSRSWRDGIQANSLLRGRCVACDKECFASTCMGCFEFTICPKCNELECSKRDDGVAVKLCGTKPQQTEHEL